MALLDQFDGDVPDEIRTDSEPLRCIHCGEEEDVDWGALDSNGASVWREPSCNTCGSSWQEVYLMHHINRIELGDKL